MKKTKKLLSLVLAMTLLISTISTTFVFTASAITEVETTKYAYTVVPDKNDPNFTSEVTSAPEPAEGNEKVTDWRYVVDSTDFKGTEVESYNFTPDGHYYNNTTYFADGDKSGFANISGYFQFKSADGNPIIDISVDAYNDYWDAVDNYYIASSNDIVISVSSNGKDFTEVHCETALSEAGRDNLKHQVYTKSFTKSDDVKYVRITIMHASAYGVASPGLKALSYNTAKNVGDWDYTVYPDKEDSNFTSEVTNAPEPAEGNEKITDWRYVVDDTDFKGTKVESYNFTPEGHYFNNTTYFESGDKSGFANISGYFQFKSADGSPITDISVDAYNDYWETVDNYYQAGNNDIEISVSSNGKDFTVINCDTVLSEAGRDNLKHQVYTKTFTTLEQIKYVRITIKHASAYGVASPGLKALSYNTAEQYSGWEYTVVPNKEDPNFISKVTSAPAPAEGNEKVTDWHYVVDDTDFKGTKVESYNFTPDGHYYNNTTYFADGDKSGFANISGYFQFKSADGSPITDISVDAYNDYWEAVDNYYQAGNNDIEISVSSDGEKFDVVYCETVLNETGRDNLKHQIYTKTFTENDLVKYVRITIKHASAYGVATAGLRSLSYNTAKPKASDWDYTVVPNKEDPNFTSEVTNAPDPAEGNEKITDWRYVVDSTDFGKKVESYNFTPKGHYFNNTTYFEGGEAGRALFEQISGYFQFKSADGSPITSISVDAYDNYYDDNSRDIEISTSTDGIKFTVVNCDISLSEAGKNDLKHEVYTKSFAENELVMYVRITIKHATAYGVATAGLKSLSYNTVNSAISHYQTTVVPDKADPNFSYESDFEFRHITGNALDKFPSNDVSSYNFTPEGFCATDYAPFDTNYQEGTPEYSRTNYTGYFQFKSENGRPITDILVDVYDDYWDLNSRDIVIQYSSNGVTFKNVDFGFKTIDDICAFDDGNFNIWRNLLKYTFEATENVQYVRCVIKSSTRYSAAAAGLRSLSYNTAEALPVADEDINDDGVVDIRDLVALKKLAIGDNSRNLLGDINSDGLINALDLSTLRKYFLTINTSIIEVDKQTGIKYLDDEFDNWDNIYQRGEDLALESYAPAMFLGDDTRVKRWNDAKDCWMTWKFDAGIEEAAVVIFGHKQYEELEVSVSEDGNEWTVLSLPTPEKISVSDAEWEKRTYKFVDIDPSNKYLKVDILAYEIRYDENGERLGNSYFPNLARVRINNIANMDVPDYILEGREPTTFYVDSISGFDTNNGTSEQTAFRSLDKVSSIDFQPGDKILLKSGQTFYGSLRINGAGTEGNGILVSTYGGNEKAKISAKTGKAVSLKAQHITVENLEVTNPNGEMGIYAMPFSTGENKGIVIKNCYIHDIDKKQTNFDQGNYDSAGISIEANGGEPTWFDGVTIENNIIEDVNRVGIIISTNWAYRPGAYGHDGYYNASDDTGRWASKNVIIRGNTVTRAYGDSIMALLCDGAIIEKNTSIEGFYNPKKIVIASAGIWTFGSNDNVIQYNDVGFHNFPEGCSDGEAFDIDKSEKRAIVQYNYSHDNDGGFLLMCNDYGADGADAISEEAVVRFNLSVNDGKVKKAAWVIDDANKGTKIYNNTTYLAPNVTQPIAHWKAPSEDFTFVNNIFVGRTGRKYDWTTMANIGEDWEDAESAWINSTFSNNIMWNVGYDLLEKIDCGMTFSNNISNVDPKFKNINIDSTTATRAQAIDAFTPTNLGKTAVDVENNGGKDIAGNTFSVIDFYGCVKY